MCRLDKGMSSGKYWETNKNMLLENCWIDAIAGVYYNNEDEEVSRNFLKDSGWAGML